MAKLILRTLSTACVMAFVIYLRTIDVFMDTRFWVLLGIFLVFGTISLIQGSVMGGENNG